MLDNAACGEGQQLKETQNFDANMCRLCSTFTCEKTTTCVRPTCRDIAVACQPGQYAVTEIRVDANQCPQCPVTTCKRCSTCPVTAIRCAPGYTSRTTNVTDSNGCVCPRQECIKTSCDQSQLFCPQVAVRCESGFVAVTTQPECGCPVTTCKQCPAIRCPEPLCAPGSTLVKKTDENGCPSCSVCEKDPCPFLASCPAPVDLTCNSFQTRVVVSPGFSPNGCPTGCESAICCSLPVCAQLRCADDEELVTSKVTDARGCPTCPKQECVKKTSECDFVACPLGFPVCTPPKVLKTTTSVDRNGCPGCPSYECVDVATCMSSTRCPPAEKPTCPPGSNPIEVKRRVFEACDQECTTYECSQVCPQIDCAAPADRDGSIACPVGTKAVTVGVELSNGCSGCPRTTCVRDACALKPRICAFIGTRCPEGTVAVTTTPKDDDGCDQCPQTTCQKKETVCPPTGCRPFTVQCKPGFNSVSVRDFDDNGCPSCEQGVCVPDSCPRVACPAVANCAGAKRVTQSFDEKGCPLCDKIECLNTSCPRLLCAQVLPSCEDGYVAEKVEESDADSDGCPSCPTYRCTKKTECPVQAFDCANVKCTDSEVSKVDRDENGCPRGCPKCVAKCATSCEDESAARDTCKSGARQSRIIDRKTQCCTWGCVGEDAVVRDTPVDPSKTGTASGAMMAALAMVMAAMAMML